MTNCRTCQAGPFRLSGIRGYTGRTGENLSDVECFNNNKPTTGGRNDHQFHTGRRRRQLAGTCGAEHYTAVLANAILKHPEWMENAAPAMAKLWRWHAIEETEHKSVAFDVYRECVGNERLRRIIFLFVTWNFFKYTFLNTCSLLKTDGKLWSLRTWAGGLNFLWGKPGILRQCLPEFLAYFRKGFHPWQQDNRALLEKNLQELDAGGLA